MKQLKSGCSVPRAGDPRASEIPDAFDNPVRLDLAAQYLANPSNLPAVAIQAGVVVGRTFRAIAYVHPDKPLSLFINEVGVSERCQGQGVGKRLMSVRLDRVAS